MKIDYGAYSVTLGPLSETIYRKARWAGDGYPAWQIFADELEKLLQFARDQGVFDMYASELVAKPGQRDAAIDELRVAHLLNDRGFAVVEWRPVGLAPKEGEFLIGCPDSKQVFVEVKRRGWQGQVSGDERRAGRLKQPKYRQTEAFWPDGGGAVGAALEKAYPKFAAGACNLLVVSDDLMFPLGIESDFWARLALYWDGGKFTDDGYDALGGVGFLIKEQSYERAWCDMRLYLNPHAQVPLPESLIAAFNGHALATA